MLIAALALLQLVHMKEVKIDISPLSDDATSWVQELPVVNFRYNSEPDMRRTGVIAEDVAVVHPEAVNFDAEKRPDSIVTEEVLYALVKEVQKLRREVDALKI